MLILFSLCSMQQVGCCSLLFVVAGCLLFVVCCVLCVGLLIDFLVLREWCFVVVGCRDCDFCCCCKYNHNICT
jgi:hypothetical protein